MILAGELAGILSPIQEKRNRLLKDPKRIREILDEGREKASAIARQTIAEVKETIF